MTIRNQKMQELTIQEANKLKQFASKTELNNLDFEELNPASDINCIYGQMTGDCYGARSSELLSKCANRMYSTVGASGYLKDSKLNGAIADMTTRVEGIDLYHSPIKVFVIQKRNKNNSNNMHLIAFLKGETKTLKFV